MTPQIGTLTLWDNPVLGNRDGVYNTIIPSAISTLGTGVQFTNVTVRSALLTETLSVQYDDNLRPMRFTYARFVGGGQTVYYFVEASTLSQRVLHLTLLVDPIATNNELTLQGITARIHSNQTNPVHNDYFLSYDAEDAFVTRRNISNTIGSVLNPTRRFVITNINIRDSRISTWANATGLNNLPTGGIPLVTTSLTFPIVTNPTGLYTSFVKPNTAMWEQNATTMADLENLQKLNMIQSVQYVYQLPQTVALTGSTPITNVQLNPINTSINIESGYTGTNQPLRRKTRITVTNIGTGNSITNFGWEFGNATATLTTSAICTPEGNAFSYFTSASLNGIGNLGALPPSARLINNPTWQQGLLDLVSPAGERFASIQSEMQRQAQNHTYEIQQRQNEWQRDQDQINAIRANISSISAIAGLLGSAGGVGNMLSLAGFASSAVTTGMAVDANNRQNSLNDRRTSQQAQLNASGNSMTLAHINAQEAVRRAVSPQRISSPSTNLSNTSMGHDIVITVESLHAEDQARLDRFYNAFGYSIRRHVTAIPQVRANHNFALFEQVNVSIPQNPLMGTLAEMMLLAGVRIWRVQPTIAGIWNNF